MVQVGRTSGGSTYTLTAGRTVYSQIYTVTTAFQADFFRSAFTTATLNEYSFAGWQKEVGSGQWYTQVSLGPGAPRSVSHDPVSLNVGDRVRFYVGNDSTSLYNVNISLGTANDVSTMYAYISGPEAHTPSITISSPSGNIGTNLQPNITWGFNDSHGLHSAVVKIKRGTTVVHQANLPAAGTFAYNALFGNVDSLSRGTSYTVEITATCGYGWTNTVSKSFSTAASTTSVNITRPTGTVNTRNPDLQATVTNNYGETVVETRWQIVGKGKTVDGVNMGVGTGTIKYDDTSNWTNYSPLSFGTNYTVALTVELSDGTTAASTRAFSTVAYEPTATLTAPLVKQNTLTPTISGAFSSTLGFSKQDHEFLVMRTNRTVIGKKTVLANSSTTFSTTYENDGTWSVYTPLEWATSYIFAVRVRDNEDIWSTTASGKASEKVIRTNTHPSPPTNLLPPNGSSVTTRQPQFSASFQDIDTMDTPLLMEVEVAGVTDPLFGFSRIENDGDEIFSGLLSDNFVIGHTYSWRTRFTDDGGLLGQWSNWSTFSVREGVETVFTHPTMNEIITTPIQTFTWSYLHPSGVPQASGRLRIYPQTGTIPLYDSGTIAGSYLSQSLPTTIFENNKTYRARVIVTDNNGDSADSGYVYFLTSWVGPEQPTSLEVETFDDEGLVRITWEATQIEGFVSYRIYRRDLSDTNNAFILVEDIRDRLATQYDYYFAPSGRPYDYAVTIVENSTGAEIESNISNFVTETIEFPHDTWLNESYDPAVYRVRLQINPQRTVNYGREAMLLQPLGRRLPVAHYGRARTQGIQVSFMIRMPFTEITLIEKMIDRNQPILYRDGRGRKYWVSLRGYEITDMTASRGTIRLELDRISSAER